MPTFFCKPRCNMLVPPFLDVRFPLQNSFVPFLFERRFYVFQHHLPFFSVKPRFYMFVPPCNDSGIRPPVYKFIPLGLKTYSDVFQQFRPFFFGEPRCYVFFPPCINCCVLPPVHNFSPFGFKTGLHICKKLCPLFFCEPRCNFAFIPVREFIAKIIKPLIPLCLIRFPACAVVRLPFQKLIFPLFDPAKISIFIRIISVVLALNVSNSGRVMPVNRPRTVCTFLPIL